MPQSSKKTKLAHIITALTLVLLTSTTYAERQLANYHSFNAILPDGENCSSQMQVTVRHPSPTAFGLERVALQRTLAALRIALGFECPDVNEILINGEVRGLAQYRGVISESTDWVLVDIPLQQNESGVVQIESRNIDKVAPQENRVGKTDLVDTIPDLNNQKSITVKEKGSIPLEVKSKLRPGLDGGWIGHTTCDLMGHGRQDDVKILLTFSSEIPGVNEKQALAMFENQPAIKLQIRTDEETYHLEFAGWKNGTANTNQKPYGMVLKLAENNKLLTGYLTGRDECKAIVLGKLPESNGEVNENGMLSQVTVNRVISPLDESQCVEFAQWIADGEIIQRNGQYKFNLAVNNAAAMQTILGHDLETWTDEDALKIQVIQWECKKILQSSNDVVSASLGADNQIWRDIPMPLRYSKSVHKSQWFQSYFGLNEAIYNDVINHWKLVKDDLFDETDRSVEVSQPKQDKISDDLQMSASEKPVPKQNDIGSESSYSSSIIGEWRGYGTCDLNRSFFIRWIIKPAGTEYKVIYEFGPSLEHGYSVGLMNMTGTFDHENKSITIEPHKWIHKPNGNIEAIGFNGTFSGKKTISGAIRGNPECKQFSVTRRDEGNKAINKDGLLYSMLAPLRINANLEQCKAYASWIASGEELRIGKTFIFSGIRDAETMRSIMGKDLYQWGDDDGGKAMIMLVQHCQKLLRAEVDPKISEIVSIANKNLPGWMPKPLASPRKERNGTTSLPWLFAEQLLMQNERQQSLAKHNLVEAEGLAAEIESLDLIDELVAEANKKLQGPLGYLSTEEMDHYLSSLKQKRESKSIAIVESMRDSWASINNDLSGLKMLEETYHKQRRQLESKTVSSSALGLLEIAFSEISSERALSIWPDLVSSSLQELTELIDADLSQFSQLAQLRDNQLYLQGFYNPSPTDSFYKNYQSFQLQYQTILSQMIDKSKSEIYSWIDGMPPSRRANNVLQQFVEDLFGTKSMPETYPDLKNKIDEIINAYNPEGYKRPDIIKSLERKHWSEVGFVALDDLAYLWTTMRTIKNYCPDQISNMDSSIMPFAMNLARDSVQRIMNGEVQSKGEASRALFLFFHQIVNQPGCLVNRFGQVIGCKTQENFAAGQDALMTSIEAEKDMHLLSEKGCGARGLGGYLHNLGEFARNRYELPVSPEIKDFWDYLK